MSLSACHPPPSTPAGTLPMPSEGNRATKDSSLFLFISHPVWFWVFVYFFFFLNCPMAMPSAPKPRGPQFRP